MTMIRSVISLIVVLGLGLMNVSCSDQNHNILKERGMSDKLPKTAPLATDADIPAGTQAKIELDSGSVIIKLLPDVAPNTVANFKVLTDIGFYDGLTFHRVIPGFMAQGGDPSGNGTGGPGYQVKAEFSDTKHVRGTLSMARSQHPDSAGSQFYICFGPQPHLDGQYTVFGQVTEGMELIDEVDNGTKINSISILP